MSYFQPSHRSVSQLQCIQRASAPPLTLPLGNLQHHSNESVPVPLVPVQEAVIAQGGELVWRICAGDLCVEAKSGPEAWERLQQLCRDAGLILATRRPAQPAVGASPLPDPGV
jgi:hypothetical protein